MYYMVPMSAAALYAIDQQRKSNFFMQPYLCADPSTAERIRGNYENKIRFFSPPEKIFETFSTQKDENHVL